MSTKYFPLIGWIVGAVYASAVILLLQLFSPIVSLLAGLVISILLTGAFHEDGFADVCDGFGGGWTKEKILTIMKDSRVGTYGVVGLVLLFGIKTSATYDMISSCHNDLIFVLVIVSSHSVSRMMSIIVIFFQRYARDENDASKAKPVASGISPLNFSTAIAFAITPFVILVTQTNILYTIAIPPMLLMTIYLMHYFKKWIGGYTGDCLGAVQQINEVVFLLSLSVIWKFT